MKYTRIIGTGSYLPATIRTNHDLASMVDTSDEWIQARTGIRQRHIAAADETTADLAFNALQQALIAADRQANELDLIIVATCTPDINFPSVAVHVQKKLGLKGCPAFDLNAACSGFVYGLDVANSLIRNGGYKCIALIGAERMSAIVDWTDRTTCVLFGDGAGATILQADERPGILSTHIFADGQYSGLLRHDANDKFIKMQGNEVFRLAVKISEALSQDTLLAAGFNTNQIDWLLPHQANSRIISAIAKKLDLPEEKVIMTIGEHGNTSAASIPLALDVAVRDGRIKPDDTILIESFGAGFTWGSVLLKY